MPIDWPNVDRVLVVKLRSIGDTVLATPSLIALRRFLPHAQIDILLEDWVAPLLDGFPAVNNVLTVASGPLGRLQTAWALSRRRYDVAFNLHGGTTATFFTLASRARHRVGLASYQYPFLYNHAYPSPGVFWNSDIAHSAEQQLSVLGFAGIPVEDRPKSQLAVTQRAAMAITDKLESSGVDASTPIALMHPAAAFETKQWAVAKFAETAAFLADLGFHTVAVASRKETRVLAELQRSTSTPITIFDDLTLPEITALASRARLFVGNDSGIAHIAAAVNTPVVVIFGSSNRDHWRPWTDAPHAVVFEEFSCQPCPGYECAAFGDSRCIRSVGTGAVLRALEDVLRKSQT